MKIYSSRSDGFLGDLPFITANFANLKLEEIVITTEDFNTKEWKALSVTGKTPLL
jgi:hypothetical protein